MLNESTVILTSVITTIGFTYFFYHDLHSRLKTFAIIGLPRPCIYKEISE